MCSVKFDCMYSWLLILMCSLYSYLLANDLPVCPIYKLFKHCNSVSILLYCYNRCSICADYYQTWGVFFYCVVSFETSFLISRIFEPEISDLDLQPKIPPRGHVLRIFTSWKNPSTSDGFEPASLGSRGENFTPRPPSSTTLTGRPTAKRLFGRPLCRWETCIRADI